MLRILTVLAVLLATPAAAQSAGSSQPAQLADSFFRAVQAGDIPKAFDDAWRGTIMAKKQAEVENLGTQMGSVFQIYGKMLGWELVSEKVISPSFVQRIYLVRTPNAPVFFRMQFYKASTSWVMSGVYFTDTYDKVAD